MLFLSNSHLSIGQVNRIRICFDPSKFDLEEEPPKSLKICVANTTWRFRLPVVWAGPYVISASCVETHNSRSKVPLLNPSLKAGEVWQFCVEVPKEGIGDWTIDILCEVAFNLEARVDYQVTISAGGGKSLPVSNADSTMSFSSALEYKIQTHKDIFRVPDLATLAERFKQVHLVILTHGLDGTILDELYLKEVLEERHMNGDINGNSIVTYNPDVNQATTRHGIDVCGKKIAEGVLKYLGWPWGDNNSKQQILPIKKISLIGHSLGGLINVCLAGYLHSLTNGRLFEEITPMHFITIATPWLGSTEQPVIFGTAMRIGLLGETGKDLILVPRSFQSTPEVGCSDINDRCITTNKVHNNEPLLLHIAKLTSSFHVALGKFQNRTIYANIANDVSVSFQTSSLYFVDFDPKTLSVPLGTSLLIHLRDVLFPPIPSEDHYSNPSSVASPILHDRIYRPEDIPPIQDKMTIEERIARLWQENMTWRKVFVYLKGPAHLHVVVRRRWLNAPGWQVIQHVINEHEF